MVSSTTRSRVALVGGGVAGIGVAAVLDAIVFHLVFQTHHLLSNIYYDGVFALGMLGVMLCGAGCKWEQPPLVDAHGRRRGTGWDGFVQRV